MVMRTLTIALLLILATFTVAGADDFSYVFTRTGHALISGHMNVDTVVAIGKRYRGDFLWVKRHGREYLIRDAATVAEAHAAFAEADELHDDYERLRERMQPLEDREEELEEQMDRESDSDSPDSAKLRELSAKLKPVTRELRALEAEEEKLDAREEKLVAAAEQELRRIVDAAVTRGKAERLK